MGVSMRGVIVPGVARSWGQVSDDTGTQSVGLARVLGVRDGLSVSKQGDAVTRLSARQPRFIDRSASA